MVQPSLITKAQEKLSHEKLYVLFAGGVGSFGTNLSILIFRNFVIWIDAGSGFPSTDQPGAIKILPDLNLVKEYYPDCIILTHGHDDHIGFIPHLVEFIHKPISVYLAPFTKELLKFKLNEIEAFSKNLKFIDIEKNKSIEHDPVKFDFFFMPHSIPHVFSTGIYFKDIQKKLYFTSDFKIQGNEPRHNSHDIQKYAPVDYLLIDSTGSLRPGSTPPESKTFYSFKREITEWPGRIFITTFASQIERIREIYRIVEESDRKLGIMGLSIRTYLKVAYEAGEFNTPPEQIQNPSPRAKRAVWLVAGCQGSVGSSFYRLARGEIKEFHWKENDLLIYSGSIIPGNETNVYNCLNEIASWGTKIIGLGQGEEFHTSGHGKQKDIQTLIKWIQPRHIMPVHGDYLHFNAFRDFLSESLGQLHLIDGSRIYELGKNVVPLMKHNAEFTYLDGSIMHHDNSLFSQRKTISINGLVSLILENKIKILSIQQVGIVPNYEWSIFINSFKSDLDHFIEFIKNKPNRAFEKKVKEFTQKKIWTAFQKKPYVLLSKTPLSNG